MPSWSLKRIGTAALGAATIAVTIALPAAAGDGIGFALDWVVNGTHAGYFVAQDKGYYGDATMRVGTSSFSSAAMIAPVSARPKVAVPAATRLTVSPEPKPRDSVTSSPAR